MTKRGFMGAELTPQRSFTAAENAAHVKTIMEEGNPFNNNGIVGSITFGPIVQGSKDYDRYLKAIQKHPGEFFWNVPEARNAAASFAGNELRGVANFAGYGLIKNLTTKMLTPAATKLAPAANKLIPKVIGGGALVSEAPTALGSTASVATNLADSVTPSILYSRDEKMMEKGREGLGRVKNWNSPSLIDPDHITNKFLPGEGEVSEQGVKKLLSPSKPPLENLGQQLQYFGGQDTERLGFVPRPPQQPVSVPPATPFSFGSWAKKHQGALWTAGGLAAGAGLLAWYNNRKQQELEEKRKRESHMRRLIPRRGYAV